MCKKQKVSNENEHRDFIIFWEASLPYTKLPESYLRTWNESKSAIAFAGKLKRRKDTAATRDAASDTKQSLRKQRLEAKLPALASHDDKQRAQFELGHPS